MPVRLTEFDLRNLIKQELVKILKEQQLPTPKPNKNYIETRNLSQMFKNKQKDFEQLRNDGTIPMIDNNRTPYLYPYRNPKTNKIDFVSYRAGRGGEEAYTSFSVPQSMIADGYKFNEYGV